MRDVRDRMGDYVRRCCGTMRVPGVTQPIELGDIYTNVNILEKLTRERRLKISELMQGCTPENFDRLQLGKVTEKRISGIDAANKYPHMMVWGKPGAGKTTFLKYLAISCMGGEFQGDRVPVFITLRNWASDSNELNLLEFVTQELANCDVTNKETVELLKQGRVVLLLDGLDEVLKEDSHRIIRQIQDFYNQSSSNVIVVTCRIAAREYTFQGFIEVEVADFDDQQIQTFVGKWFQQKSPVKAERFIEKLKDNEPVKELANNPLLLTLLCFVFEANADFPSNRAQLYREGLDVMLKKWDASRDIDRDIIYKNLSPNRKEDLLSQIAWTTFEGSKYFFGQDIAKKYIADYIINLPEAQIDPEALLVDSEAVLKSIESQHGLLVERAKYIYSFSHLSFQEYFAARRAIATDKTLLSLVIHTDDLRWREVFLLALGILQDGSELLRLMKQQIDNLVAADEKIQQILVWVKNKSASIETDYKPAAIKAFYLALADQALQRALALAVTFDRDLDRDLDLAFDCPVALTSNLLLPLDQAVAVVLTLNLDIDFNLVLKLDQALKIYRASYLDLVLDRVLFLGQGIDFKLKEVLHQIKQQFFDRKNNNNFKNWWRENGDSWSELFKNIIIKYHNIKLKEALHQLKQQLPDCKDDNNLEKWWQENGDSWSELLRNIMIKYRNIGHDWQLNDKQKELLKRYYDANKLLVDCLNSDCDVSREIRQEIEDTFLLPISDIRKRQKQPITERSPTLKIISSLWRGLTSK